MNLSCIAHRGASGVAPENSMLAFWTAVISHADMIELDVQISKDRKPVIFHDRTLSRITGDDFGIADLTCEELKNKDIGSWMNKEFSEIRMPTLDDVLDELPLNLSLIVEVKPQKNEIEKNRSLERLILDSLDDKRKESRLVEGYISVRDEETLQWFRENSSKYQIGLMQKKRTVEEFLAVVKEYKVQYSQIRWRKYAERDFKELGKTGTKTMAFYSDSPKEWDFLISQGVDGILTNYPSLLSGYLRQRNQKKFMDV